MFAHLNSGRGVIIALPHMGNFEQAGVWVIARGAGTFTTVAERLKPESVYESFVRFRQTPGLRGPAADRRSRPVPDPGGHDCGPAAWSAWSVTAT